MIEKLSFSAGGLAVLPGIRAAHFRRVAAFHGLGEAPCVRAVHAARLQSDPRGVGIAVSLLAALIVSRFPSRPVVFIFFAFVFTPAVLFNTLFHVGASVLTRSYDPGAITAVAIYLPLFAVITALAYGEGLLGMGALSRPWYSPVSFTPGKSGTTSSKRSDLTPISRNKPAPRRINRANRRSSNEHFQNKLCFRRPA